MSLIFLFKCQKCVSNWDAFLIRLNSALRLKTTTVASHNPIFSGGYWSKGICKAFITCNTNCFWSVVNVTQLSKSSFNSGDSSTISFSAKKCDRVIPKLRQITSNVSMEGVEFLRNILASVDSDSPHSFDKRYSDHPLSFKNSRSLLWTSTESPPLCNYFTVTQGIMILLYCNLITIILNHIGESYAKKVIDIC